MLRRVVSGRRRRIALAVACAALTTGCSEFSADGLQFVRDESLEFVSPSQDAVVTAPVEVRWTDDARPPGSRYAIVVNRVPMPPGEDLTWFVRDDDACERRASCPTLDDLRLRGVVVTDITEALIEVIPGVVGGRESGHDELVLIRIDEDGRRISEAAVVRRLDIERGPGL